MSDHLLWRDGDKGSSTEMKEDYYASVNQLIYFTLGNGYCDTVFNTRECCWDGGDCILTESCPTCNLAINATYGDAICDPYYNTAECCFDDGDCSNVSI